MSSIRSRIVKPATRTGVDLWLDQSFAKDAVDVLDRQRQRLGEQIETIRRMRKISDSLKDSRVHKLSAEIEVLVKLRDVLLAELGSR